MCLPRLEAQMLTGLLLPIDSRLPAIDPPGKGSAEAWRMPPTHWQALAHLQHPCQL